MDPQPQLDMTLLNASLFIVTARQVAGLHRHAQTPEVIAGLLRNIPHFTQRFPLLRRIARNLMHQRRTGNTARLFVVGQRDIVRHNHHFDLQPVTFGLLGRQTEVQPIAGVIFDNQQAAAIARDRDNGIQHRIHARRGKQIAADGSRQHAFADKPGMRGLVARAAAGDHRHAAFVPVTARDNPDSRINIEFDEIRVWRRKQYAFNGIVDQLFAIVKEESGHSFPLFC